MSAAEIAGAQAGMTAAYAAYGYNFTGKGMCGTMWMLLYKRQKKVVIFWQF